MDLDDVAVVAEPEPVRPAASDELRVAQAVRKLEKTFRGEDEATHPSASHIRGPCQIHHVGIADTGQLQPDTASVNSVCLLHRPGGVKDVQARTAPPNQKGQPRYTHGVYF